MWFHACIQLYYLGVKKCSSNLEKEINYNSKITTHIIYMHDNFCKYPVVSDWMHVSLLSGTKTKPLTKFIHFTANDSIPSDQIKTVT